MCMYVCVYNLFVKCRCNSLSSAMMKQSTCRQGVHYVLCLVLGPQNKQIIIKYKTQVYISDFNIYRLASAFDILMKCKAS